MCCDLSTTQSQGWTEASNSSFYLYRSPIHRKTWMIACEREDAPKLKSRKRKKLEKGGIGMGSEWRGAKNNYANGHRQGGRSATQH